MITSEIKAQFSLSGQIKIALNCDVTTHQSREMLDALASVLNETWVDGNIARTDKEKISLARKPKDGPDQETIPLNDGQSVKELPAPEEEPGNGAPETDFEEVL